MSRRGHRSGHTHAQHTRGRPRNTGVGYAELVPTNGPDLALPTSGLSDDQINIRLAWLEQLMATADPKDLPSLNATYQRLIEVQVGRDLGLK